MSRGPGARVHRRALIAGWLVALLTAVAVPALATTAEGLAADPDEVGFFVLFTSGIAVNTALAATIGLILLLRVPGNRVGALMYAGAPLLASCLVGWSLTVMFEASGGPTDPRAGLAALWGSVVLPIALFLAFTAVGICFPDGRLPGPRWRLPFLALVAGFALSSLLFAIAPWPTDGSLPLNPLALPGVPVAVSEVATAVSTATLIASFGLATAAAVVRWRRSRGVERAQMKWFVGGIAVALVVFPVSWVTDTDGDALDLLSVVSMALVPVAIGIAITRYRLYDIDRLISRTIGWAVVTGALVALFALLVVGLQTALGSVTQGQTLAVAASTLVAFALFQPSRRRVQGAVDRRFDRSRYDAERVAAALATRLRDEVDLAVLRAEIVETATGAVRPAGAALWLRSMTPTGPGRWNQ